MANKLSKSNNLEYFFTPKSIAIIGAAREEGKVGHEIFDNIINSKFKGKCYPVNPHAEFIHNHKSFKSILDIKQNIDLAIIIIPAKYVNETIEECGIAKVKSVIIISAGFKESGPAGALLEKEIHKTSKKYGIRIIGPNTLGIINANINLNASFASEMMPLNGNISFISQSGALLTAILDWAIAEEIGFSKIVSLGNKSDISEIELLSYLNNDENTDIIVIYIEGFKDGRKFRKLANSISRNKPIIAIKSGSTNAGARAVSSHTGSLAGSEVAFISAFKQSGIIKADSIEQLFDYAICFSGKKISKLNNVAIITNAGGPGILATDYCEKVGLSLAQFEYETITKLREKLPPAANIYNPVDILGDALAKRYKFAIETVLNDANVDSILCILTPQAMTETEETAKIIDKLNKASNKLIIACFIGEMRVNDAIKYLRTNKVPTYSFPERGVKSIKTLSKYIEYKNLPEENIKKYSTDTIKVSRVIRNSLNSGNRQLSDTDVRSILKSYKITIPKYHIAANLKEALSFADKCGYPVVLKISSPEILHKSDVGGVKVGISTDKELKDGFNEIINNVERYMPNAHISGISVEKQVLFEREVIIGMNNDPHFGPLIMFGLGGVYVEFLKDVAFRLAPVSKEEAMRMIKEIKSYPLLIGVRGKEGVNIDAIIDVILKVSQLVTENKEIMELDINPLMVGSKNAIAVDARISI